MSCLNVSSCAAACFAPANLLKVISSSGASHCCSYTAQNSFDQTPPVPYYVRYIQGLLTSKNKLLQVRGEDIGAVF